jgi:hypothetical protein
MSETGTCFRFTTLTSRSSTTSGNHDVLYDLPCSRNGIRVSNSCLHLHTDPWITEFSPAADESNPRMPHFTRNLGVSTGSLEGVRQSQNWLHQCTSNHKVCNAIGISCDFVPTRLVQITGPEKHPILRIAHTSEWKRRPIRPYATLSHCWGRKIQCRLLRSNVDQYRRALPVTELSPLFRDAISVTR